MDAEQAWQAALGQLSLEMPKSSFDQWVGDTHVVSYDDGLFQIGAPNAYARDWLECRLTRTVAHLLEGIMNRSVVVQFVVEKRKEAEEEQREEVKRDKVEVKEERIPTASSEIKTPKGWTPLSDELVEKHGVLVAAVGGKIWRYGQMKDRVCRATESRLANELKISRRTIIRAIKTLLLEGYVVDLTPTLHHRPHVYVTTEKMFINGSKEQGLSVTGSHTETRASFGSTGATPGLGGVTQDPSSATPGLGGATQDPTSVTQGTFQCDSGSLKLNKKRKQKKQEESIAVVEISPTEKRKELLLQILFAEGIVGKKAHSLSTMQHVNEQYIHEHVAYARARNEGLGLAIIRMEQGERIPKLQGSQDRIEGIRKGVDVGGKIRSTPPAPDFGKKMEVRGLRGKAVEDIVSGVLRK
jgi:hypothetical protein